MVLNYFWESEHIPYKSIALLSEDQTQFGNFSGVRLEGKASIPSAAKSEGALVFHFPREISQLRNAYEENSILSASSSNQNPNVPNQALKLSLEDRHEQEDDVPSFSNQQDSVSEESILSSITRTMAAHDIQVVVISATDVLDEMFVARFLSRDLPNARIVLTDTDQILLRRSDPRNFRGMLTATTYPLIEDDTGWSRRFLAGRPRDSLPDGIFPSTDVVGIYNAMRVLEPLATLSDNQTETVCVGPGCESRWLSGYEDPLRGGDRPPLWLSAIGRDGFWPVALLNRIPQDHPLNSDPSTTSKIYPGNSSGVIACPPQDTIPPGMFPRLSKERLRADEFRRDLDNWLLLIIEVILAVFAIWLIRAALNTRQRPFWAALLLVLTIVAQVFFNRVLLREDFARQVFYFYRSEHLLSDVSPVMPFVYLFAAFICLVSRHIQALLVFSRDWRPQVPCYKVADNAKVMNTEDGKAIEDIFGACSSSWRLLHGKIRGGDKDPHGLPVLLFCTCFVLVFAIVGMVWL